MEKKNLNLIISAGTFILGAAYILSDTSSVTADVIGAGGDGGSLASIIGIVMIVASAIFFMLTINHGDYKLETLVRKDDNKHEEIRAEIDKKEIEEKYKQEHHEHKE